jgi:hypothetical protein
MAFVLCSACGFSFDADFVHLSSPNRCLHNALVYHNTNKALLSSFTPSQLG